MLSLQKSEKVSRRQRQTKAKTCSLNFVWALSFGVSSSSIKNIKFDKKFRDSSPVKRYSKSLDDLALSVWLNHFITFFARREQFPLFLKTLINFPNGEFCGTDANYVISLPSCDLCNAKLRISLNNFWHALFFGWRVSICTLSIAFPSSCSYSCRLFSFAINLLIYARFDFSVMFSWATVFF